jgi:Ulp1 family protease
MIVETKAKALPVGFLDRELMSLSTIQSDKSYVVDYVTKAFRHFAKKEIIMFAHNPGDHWILVVIIPKWSKVLYFDSLRSKPHDHTLLKEVIDEAFHSYLVKGKASKSLLVHVSKFPCHQQSSGNTNGFYTAHYVMVAMEILKVEDPWNLK